MEAKNLERPKKDKGAKEEKTSSCWRFWCCCFSKRNRSALDVSSSKKSEGSALELPSLTSSGKLNTSLEIDLQAVDREESDEEKYDAMVQTSENSHPDMVYKNYNPKEDPTLA